MRTHRTLRNFILLFILSIVSATAGNVEWDIRSYRGQDYVSLNQVKSFYKFTSLETSGGSIKLKNTEYSLKFSPGSQEVLVSGVKFIFSNAIIAISGNYYISTVDLTKIIDPILRPRGIKEATAFDTVIIDPGHGGEDSGGNSIYGREADYNLKVGLIVRDYLKKIGFKVVMTRDSDRFLSLSQRVAIANKYQNAVFVSIHFNSTGSGRAQARGIETFTLSPVGVPHYGRSLRSSDSQKVQGNLQDSANIALATAIHWRAIAGLAEDKMPVPDRGIRRARFSVLMGIKHPAILLEGGFLSHPTESRLINSQSYQKTLAKQIAGGIFAYRKATVKSASQGTVK